MTTNGIMHCRIAPAILCALTASVLSAQVPAAQSPEAAATPEEQTIELSPFVVNSDKDTGYSATSTLGGTRVRTELRDIASSLSVVTSQFLKDTGATSNESLLQYQTNTEVGGMSGNFAGVGNVQGASEAGKIARPNTNTRVRGLDEADNTRDYFLTDIPWDAYIVDRVDLQRGPNSILFGVGSPAGIINTTTIGARLDRSSGKFESSNGSYGSFRNTLDYNQVLVPGKLALRVSLLEDRAKFRQDPAFSNDRRIFGALRYSEQLLPKSLGDKFTLRVNAEGGTLRSNRPRMMPPIDRITPFFNSSIFPRVNGRVKLYDPYYSWYYGQQLDRGTRTLSFASDPDFRGVPGLGNDQGVSGGGPVAVYNNGDNTITRFQSEGATTMYGRKSDGTVDMGIDAFPFGRLQGVAGIFEYSQNLNRLDPSKYPAASKGFYKDTVIQDPSLFDFYNKLIDGDNKREWTDFKSINLSASQNFLGNRLGLEFVYDYQDVTVGQRSQLGWLPGIDVDVNLYTLETPRTYTPKSEGGYALESTGTGGVLNPNAGRAFISGQGSGSSRNTVREDVRLTAYGELRGADLFDSKSFLARLLTRNVVSALYSNDTVDSFEKSWALERTDVAWAQRMGQPAGINEYARRVPAIVYLSGDLTGTASSAGLGLDRIRTVISPYGTMQGRYFNSNWKYPLDPAATGYVDPSAAFRLPVTGGASTQSENPANYVGWTTASVNILSAAHGDIDQLMLDASKRHDKLESQGLTLQSFLWDDTLIPTIGWRKDRITTYGTSGARDPLTQVATTDFENVAVNADTSQGETTTWGVVARIPRNLRRKLPLGADLSLFYNNSENFRAVNRVGFDTKPLPSPKGKSKDYGFVLSALEDKVSFRMTWFDTVVKDADIPGGNALGQNSWFLNSMQVWGVAAIQTIKAGRRNEAPGMEWFWNYALVDENKWGDPVWTDGTSTEVVTHASMVKQWAAVEDWIKTMPDQAYFDGYGYDVDVAKVKSADWNQNKTAIMGGAWNMYSTIGSIQSPNGNRVNGQAPLGTIDQSSKGLEFELTAQPLHGWDLSVNAAKTTAARGDLGSSFVAWIEGQKTRLDGPSGDLRLWWGGDQTYRQYFDQFIYQPYLFQKDAKGQMAPEIRPWRFNVVSNYRFDRGVLKGLNVGGGYRWQDDVILGYQLNDAKTQLDVNRPIRGASEDAIDAWVGYERALTKKVRWRVQLNLRNVADKAHLVPVSANPDGTIALMRVVDGCSWTLRNTFEF